MYCPDPVTKLAVRVNVPGARQYQTPLSYENNLEPPLNDNMCNRCYNTSWYTNGYTSTPLEFTCYAVDTEKQKIQDEINTKLQLELKKKREEADNRRKIIQLVSKLQANYRRKKTGHVWGGRLKNLHVELLIKKSKLCEHPPAVLTQTTNPRHPKLTFCCHCFFSYFPFCFLGMDKLQQFKKSWYYKVSDAVDKAPVLESDSLVELQRKIIPRQITRSKLQRLYPWMSTKQLNAVCLKGTKPTGVKKAVQNIQWTFSKKPIQKLKNGVKASVQIAGITAEAIMGDSFDAEHRERYALWMAQKASQKKRAILTSAGNRLNKRFTSTAANLERRFDKRNFLTKAFRRRARKMLLMSKKQHRLNRRDALMKERWVEIDQFREIELNKWKKAMDFELNKKVSLFLFWVLVWTQCSLLRVHGVLQLFAVPIVNCV